MKQQSIFLATALLALALGFSPVNGITFTANLTPVGGPSVTGSGTVLIQADDEQVSWQIEVSDVVGLSLLQIVDGQGTGSVEGITLKTFDPPVDGTQNISGSFDGSDLNPAVAGNAGELAGHICMGHIYASAKMVSGQMLMGAINYVVPENGSTMTCDDAVRETYGTSHSGADMDMDKAMSSSVISTISRNALALMMAVAVIFITVC